MSEQQTNNLPHENAAIELGAHLRQLRQERNLSIGETSERLKLPARQIEALERADYSSMPEAVFVRGFLRSYGRFLGMDEAVLNDYLERALPSTKVSRNLIQNNIPLDQEGSRFPTWLLGLAAAILIGGGIYAWQSKSSALNEQETESALPEMEVSGVLENMNTTVEAMSASESNIAETASEAATTNTEMIIRPRYRSMLTVRNAKGEILINQIVPARSEHRFSEGAPFEVRVGYAIGASIEFNGETILLDSKRQGKTAVLTVGATQ